MKRALNRWMAALWRISYCRGGQTSVEYLLLLAAVVGVLLMTGALFHRKLMGGLFTVIGMIIGQPSSAS